MARSTGMTWWGESLRYMSGPVVAAGALLWQQRRTDARDDRRREDDRLERKAEREGAAEEAERAWRQTLSERWRDTRFEAYSAFASATREAVSKDAMLAWILQREGADKQRLVTQLEEGREDGELDEVESRLTMVASDEVLAIARDIAAKALLFRTSLFIKTHRAPGASLALSKDESDELDAYRQAVYSLIEKFEAAARADLEVGGEGASHQRATAWKGPST